MDEAQGAQHLPRDLFEVGQVKVGPFLGLPNELAELVEVLPEQLRDDEQVLLVVEKVVPIATPKMVCIITPMSCYHLSLFPSLLFLFYDNFFFLLLSFFWEGGSRDR